MVYFLVRYPINYHLAIFSNNGYVWCVQVNQVCSYFEFIYTRYVFPRGLLTVAAPTTSQSYAQNLQRHACRDLFVLDERLPLTHVLTSRISQGGAEVIMRKVAWCERGLVAAPFIDLEVIRASGNTTRTEGWQTFVHSTVGAGVGHGWVTKPASPAQRVGTRMHGR